MNDEKRSASMVQAARNSGNTYLNPDGVSFDDLDHQSYVDVEPGEWTRPVKRLELKAISDHAFGLFEGETLMRRVLYEARIDLSPGFKRKMTLVADPREARILGPYGELEIIFGGVSFLRSKDQVEILWRYEEAPLCFPKESGEEVTIRRSGSGRGHCWVVAKDSPVGTVTDAMVRAYYDAQGVTPPGPHTNMYRMVKESLIAALGAK